VFIGKTVNTAFTVYCIGQIALVAYRKVRTIQNEKLRAAELRDSFIEEFEKETGLIPDESIIRAALKSYNVVEHPVRQWVDDTIQSCSDTLDKCFVHPKDEVIEINGEKNE
jgi:hypothetical protein